MNLRKIGTVFLAALLLVVGTVSAEEVNILSRDLSTRSKNVSPVYDQFGGLTLATGKEGYAEWTLKLASPYSETFRGYLHILYASGERRGCKLTVNGKAHSDEVLSETTGGFMPAHLKWVTIGPLDFRKGNNTVRIDAAGFMPHFKGLSISSSKRPPKASVFQDPAAKSASLANGINLTPLRQAILHLSKEFGDEYPQAKKFLARVAAIEKELASTSKDGSNPQHLRALSVATDELRYEALVAANPLMQFEKMLLVKRKTYQSSHYYTDFIDGCKHFGGNLCVLSLADGTVKELAPEMKEGIFDRYDLSWDGKRIVFSHKPAPGKGFRIYEVGVDGSDLRPVTQDPADEQARIDKYWLRNVYRDGSYKHQTDDMHPCWLPDGDICFTSSRCERGILCDGPDRLTTTVLYRVSRDGKKMRELSHAQLSEFTPVVLDDGRILYNRWE